MRFEDRCGPLVWGSFDAVELGLKGSGGKEVLPEVARPVREAAKTGRIDGDGRSEDVVDEVEIVLDVLVLLVELHGDVFK